ncbi:MAG: proline dehydrogenase family protein [Chloroflexi bacterium]|nr:proline dehydrogenase family protein [Chloroflexota bacterium]
MGTVLRGALLYLSEQPSIERLVRDQPALRGMARRFVAGERIDEAIEVVRALNARGIRASLDHLGEHVTSAAEARRAAEWYCTILDTIARTGVDSNVSVKLTQFGLALDPEVSTEVCTENLRLVAACAGQYGNFVRIDMESSAYTERTLRIFRQLFPEHPALGVVIQAYLYRSEKDLRELIALGARVRLCKGAYKEPPHVAYPSKADVDRNFLHLMRLLIDGGVYPAIATHDERIIRATRAYADQRGRDRQTFEFQMLYGIRRDLQQQLVQQGYNVRVYVPFGDHWYPYLLRRLAERPANLGFVLANLFRR